MDITTPIYAAREARIDTNEFPDAGVPQLIAKECRDRVAIIFQPQVSTRWFVLPKQSVNTIDNIVVDDVNRNLPLLVRDFGPMVTGEWWGLASALGGKIFVIEVIQTQKQR